MGAVPLGRASPSAAAAGLCPAPSATGCLLESMRRSDCFNLIGEWPLSAEQTGLAPFVRIAPAPQPDPILWVPLDRTAPEPTLNRAEPIMTDRVLIARIGAPHARSRRSARVRLRLTTRVRCLTTRSPMPPA